MFDGYAQRLQQAFLQLTDKELEICLLIKLQVPHQVMAEMLGVTPAAVSKRKHRLKTGVFKQVCDWGSWQTLEKWLLEY